MSNNNHHWAKRHGYVHADGTGAFTVKQLSSGASNSGPHQTALDPRTPAGMQAAEQRRLHQLNGRPVHYHDWRGRKAGA